MDNTKIEWTDATWQAITGCSVTSPGCTNCYAMKLAGTRLRHHPSRIGLTDITKSGPVWNGEVRFNQQWLDQPLRWRRPRKIFVCAHGDLFHESVPDEWIDEIFAVMAIADHHIFQVLTKRARRMRDYLSQDRRRQWADAAVHRWGGVDPDALHDAIWNGSTVLSNVWLGVSVEDQQHADERIPLLIQTPAAVRWISAEPMLGAISFRWLPAWPENAPTVAQNPDGGGKTNHLDGLRRLDWIVVGGESGDGARPMHPAWVRQIRDQCREAGVAFLFKQWGQFTYHEYVNGALEPAIAARDFGTLRVFSEAADAFVKPDPTLPVTDVFVDGNMFAVRAASKAAVGRLLDGVEWNQYPAIGAAE